MCQPVEFGISDEGVYSIYSWIDGDSAEKIIPLLCEREQYDYGLKSGRILSRIHSITADDSREDWATRFNRKIDTKIRNYGECPVKYPKGQVFMKRFLHGMYTVQLRIDRAIPLQGCCLICQFVYEP